MEKYKINKDKNGEKLPHLEITEVMLVHWNIINNNYLQDSRVLYIFVINIFHRLKYDLLIKILNL